MMSGLLFLLSQAKIGYFFRFANLLPKNRQLILLMEDGFRAILRYPTFPPLPLRQEYLPLPPLQYPLRPPLQYPRPQ